MSSPITLPVKHLIYSRVESEYSPRRRAGYQVVYHSPELTAEVPEIEKRVQCFQSSDQDRLQFFTTSTGNVVLSRTSPIVEPDRTIIDRNLRPGAFITQAYVLTPATFSRVENDPFAILDASDLFNLSDESEFIARVPSLAANPPSPEIMVEYSPRNIEPDEEHWSQTELAKLWQVTIDAAGFTEQKQSLMLLGDDDHETMVDMLRLLHQLLDRNNRLPCTFDTFVDGCQPLPGLYWAVIGTKRVTTPGFVRVRFDKYVVELKSAPDPKATHYTRWLRHSWQQSGKLSAVVAKVVTAQIASASFAEGMPLPSQLTSPEFTMSDQALLADVLNQVIAANAEEYTLRLNTIIAAALTPPVAGLFVPALDDYLSIVERFNATASNTIAPTLLADAVYNWLVTVKPPIKSWKPLLALGESADHVPLRLLATIKHSHGTVIRRLPLSIQSHISSQSETPRYVLLSMLSEQPSETQMHVIETLYQADRVQGRAIVNTLFGARIPRRHAAANHHHRRRTGCRSVGELLFPERRLSRGELQLRKRRARTASPRTTRPRTSRCHAP